MRLGDRALGLLTLLGGIGLFLASLQFSPIPGQKYGAETLPRVVALLAAGIGVTMLARGITSARGEPLARLSDWAGSRAAWLRLGGTLALIALYIALADWLGFTIAGFGLILGLLILTGTRLIMALPVALVATLAVQFAFGRLLLVPLPRGEILNLPW